MSKPWWAGLLVVLQVIIAFRTAEAQIYTVGSAPTIDDLTYSSTSGYAASDRNNVAPGAMVTLAIPASSWIDYDNLEGASGTLSTPDEIGQISWSVDSDVVALSETAGYYTSFTVPASLTDSTITVTATIRDSGLEGIDDPITRSLTFHVVAVKIQKIVDTDTEPEGDQPDDTSPLKKYQGDGFLLEAKPDPDGATFAPQPSWTITGAPNGSSLATGQPYATGTVASFMPDRIGTYEITATSGASSKSISVNYSAVGILKIIDSDSDPEGDQSDDVAPLQKIVDEQFQLQAIPDPEFKFYFPVQPQWEVVDQPSGSNLSTLGSSIPFTPPVPGDYTLRAFVQIDGQRVSEKQIALQAKQVVAVSSNTLAKITTFPQAGKQAFVTAGMEVTIRVFVEDTDLKATKNGPDNRVMYSDLSPAQMTVALTATNAKVLTNPGETSKNGTRTHKLDFIREENSQDRKTNKIFWESSEINIKIDDTWNENTDVTVQVTLIDECVFKLPPGFVFDKINKSIQDNGVAVITLKKSNKPYPMTMTLQSQKHYWGNTEPVVVDPPGTELVIATADSNKDEDIREEGSLLNIYKFGPDLLNDGMDDYVGLPVSEINTFGSYAAAPGLTVDMFNDEVIMAAKTKAGVANPTVDQVVQSIYASASSLNSSTFFIGQDDTIYDTFFDMIPSLIQSKMKADIINRGIITVVTNQEYKCPPDNAQGAGVVKFRTKQTAKVEKRSIYSADPKPYYISSLKVEPQ